MRALLGAIAVVAACDAGTRDDTRAPAEPPEPAPSTPATIVTRSSGGFSGRGHGGVSIWSDGTVIFHGRQCKQLRGHRTKVAAEQVAALVAELERQGVFAHDSKDSDADCGGPDAFYSRITLRTANHTATVARADDCPQFSAALAAIEKTVGNLCQ